MKRIEFKEAGIYETSKLIKEIIETPVAGRIITYDDADKVVTILQTLRAAKDSMLLEDDYHVKLVSIVRSFPFGGMSEDLKLVLDSIVKAETPTST